VPPSRGGEPAGNERIAGTAGRERRADVQALRAVAVASVVLYHLWPSAVPGGFTGVDVFFTISGFLITSLLARELASTGRISLTRFWARRIRRLLPAAFVVLGACLAVVVLLLPRLLWPADLAEIRAAAAYSENWLLAAHAVDYLAAENEPSIVQHYWSLSVEEQFYLAWPLLLLLATGTARLLRRERPDRWLTGVLLVATAASLVASVRWTAADPAVAFFATPVRAWEFGAGGLVAVLAPGIRRRAPETLRILAAWSGLGLVVASCAVISSSDPFPGALALVPVGAAAVYLAADTPVARWSPHRALSARPVQWLGDNSYAIYLWHWPLVIAAPWVAGGSTPWWSKCAVLAATLVLAGLTRRLVEDPIRFGRRWSSRRWPAYAFAVAGVLTLVTVTSDLTVPVQRADTVAVQRIHAQTRRIVSSHHRSCFGAAAMLPANDCSQPYARPAHLDLSLAASDGPADPCLQRGDPSAPSFCVIGRRQAPTRTIAVVGNSHAWRLLTALGLYGRQNGWQVLGATRINCLGLITRATGPDGASPNCLRWSAAVQQRLLATPHLDAVVFPSYRFAADFLGGRDATPADIRRTREAVLRTWTAFARHGTRVIVTGDVPGMRPDADPECLAQSRESYDPCATPRTGEGAGNLPAALAEADPSRAAFLSLARYFCDAAKCHALIGGVVVYFDSHHLTTTYAQSLADDLGDRIAAVLRSPASAGPAPGGSR
jgi:peptidoglycan/LPS O-acetylase OafA/YrhL